jgi:hypothetical protein
VGVRINAGGRGSMSSALNGLFMSNLAGLWCPSSLE